MPVQRAAANYSEVSALLDELVSSSALPCASILIYHAGEEAYYHQVGLSDVASGKPLSRDTIFRLFSMTKPITAAAVMILVDEGALRLEDKVADYIPEFADLEVYLGQSGDVIQSIRARPMTIRHLLTHTAGFSYWFYPNVPVGALYAADPGIGGVDERWRFDPSLGGLNGLARSLARWPLMAQPGERWHYSMSMDVAGIVIERCVGDSFDAFLKKRIFEPLAMNDTGFFVGKCEAKRLASLYGPKSQDGGANRLDSLYDTKAAGGIALLESGADSPLVKSVTGFSGGGGLVSTIEDYCRFAEMLRRGEELEGRRIVSEHSVRAMITNQLRPEQLAELPELAVFGLGGVGDGLGFGLGGSVVLDPPSNGVPAFRGEYAWGGGASTTFWIDPENELTVVFMTQLQPPSSQMIRDKLHSAVYNAMGLSGSAS